MNLARFALGVCLAVGLAACNAASPAPDATPPGEVTALRVTPSSVLLTQEGQQRDLLVRAFDADGREVEVEGLDLEWLNSAPDAIRLDPSGHAAAVSAEAFLGSSTITARLRGDPISRPRR